MRTQDHLPLAPRDLLILAVLAEGPHHGYGIIKAVEARSESGVLLDPANLYRVLRRMRGFGWIREAEEEGADPGGREARERESGPGARKEPGPPAGARTPLPRRRTYEITMVGARLLSEELARLERLLGQVRPALAGRDGG
ncbi:MAG: PadR family transcriptional regulator [Longimicrobiales bacterium]